MTTADPTFANPSAAVDPHASKVAPNDPRLRLGRAPGRTLKKGPAIAIACGLFGVLTLCMLIAFQPASAKPIPAKTETEVSPTPAPTTPVLPDTIRNGPEMAAAMATAPDAGGFAPFRADGGSALHRGYSEGSNDPYSPAHQQRQRTEQYWKAHNAGILFEVKQPENSSDNGRPQDAARLPNAAAGPSGTAPGADDDPNLQGRKNSFLSGTGAAAAQDYVSSRLQRPRSPYEIKAGTVIPTVLITAINSDLPGPVVGQVRENVYDTVSGNYLLIPQGARLIANYDSMVAWGQERVLVCWNRLIFQDGSSINLQCMPAADLHGAAGLADEVNEHWGRLIQGVAVASLLAATTQSVAGSTQGFNPTLPQTWARSAAGEMNSAGQQITRRNINIQPTITVRPGFSVNVIVTKDLTLPPRSGGSTLNPMP